MPALDALRRRMDVVARLRSVIHTMKLLAAASIRQYEEAVHALVEYERTIDLGLQVALTSPTALPIRASPEESAGIGIVAFGSDLGLCGSFNEEIARRVSKVADPEDRDAHAEILTIGERLATRLAMRGICSSRIMRLPASIASMGEAVQDVAAHVEEWQSVNPRRVLLIFDRYQEAECAVVVQQLFPLDLRRLRKLRRRPWPTRIIPMVLGDWERLFHALVRQHLWVSLFRAIAESQAAESSSRLRAMQAAEKNIDERLSHVQRSYYRQRQDAITEEMIDVVVGCESQADRSGS